MAGLSLVSMLCILLLVVESWPIAFVLLVVSQQI
jgi:hypothetical protein